MQVSATHKPVLGKLTDETIAQHRLFTVVRKLLILLQLELCFYSARARRNR